MIDKALQKRVEDFFFANHEVLDNLCILIDECNDAKGWNEEEKSEAEWAALAHTEISAAFEAYRNNEPLIWFKENGKPEGAAIEYADALIRIFHWFQRNSQSVEKALLLKMVYNTSRPHRHGGKRV